VTDQAKLIRIGLDSLRVIGRGSAGVRLFNVADDEHIVSAVRLDEEEASDDDVEDATAAEANGDDAGPGAPSGGRERGPTNKLADRA
jgi:DNA gyrase subunit A